MAQNFLTIGPYTRVNKNNVTYITYFEKEKKLHIGFVGCQPYILDLSAIEEQQLKQYLNIIFGVTH